MAITGRRRLRRFLAGLAIAVVLAAGPLISCEFCCRQYWGWWCWLSYWCDCSVAGGGGESGAR